MDSTTNPAAGQGGMHQESKTMDSMTVNLMTVDSMIVDSNTVDSNSLDSKTGWVECDHKNIRQYGIYREAWMSQDPGRIQALLGSVEKDHDKEVRCLLCESVDRGERLAFMDRTGCSFEPVGPAGTSFLLVPGYRIGGIGEVLEASAFGWRSGEGGDLPSILSHRFTTHRAGFADGTYMVFWPEWSDEVPQDDELRVKALFFKEVTNLSDENPRFCQINYEDMLNITHRLSTMLDDKTNPPLQELARAIVNSCRCVVRLHSREGAQMSFTEELVPRSHVNLVKNGLRGSIEHSLGLKLLCSELYYDRELEQDPATEEMLPQYQYLRTALALNLVKEYERGSFAVPMKQFDICFVQERTGRTLGALRKEHMEVLANFCIDKLWDPEFEDFCAAQPRGPLPVRVQVLCAETSFVPYMDQYKEKMGWDDDIKWPCKLKTIREIKLKDEDSLKLTDGGEDHLDDNALAEKGEIYREKPEPEIGAAPEGEIAMPCPKRRKTKRSRGEVAEALPLGGEIDTDGLGS